MKIRDNLLKEIDFSRKFWMETLLDLSYQLKEEEFDVKTLKGQRAFPQEFATSRVTRLYSDDYVEMALIETEERLSRSVCTRAARMWKENRMIRPVLLFTDGKESFAIIIPGKGIVGGEARVLNLSERLYRTDLEVLESMRFPGNIEALVGAYDNTLFPYDKVRAEFFEGYRDLYQDLEDAIRKELREKSTSFAQRFLGRLMFLYFLQKKGWLKGNKRFIDTIRDYRELNTLFYESLNKEGTPGIPYLNGSLFEREDYLTKAMENRLFSEIDPIFNKARAFFDQYNFTVDESSPLEVEVSVDPMLIGSVFENMLPEYERGAKGTFYTHRNEVSFICRRAIVNYLGLNDDIKKSPEGKDEFCDGLSSYIRRLNERKSEKEVREFRDKLLSLKVLDPAVGSGGFLLVMMQEIINLIQEAEQTVGWISDPEELKKKILPNLHGFDIESEAVEIARLRLWLSLIIDEKEPEPLPNLDMNLVEIRDSLSLPPSQTTLDLTIEGLREKSNEIRAKYLNEHDGRKKKELKQELRSTFDRIAKKTKTDPETIEVYMGQPADIIVMNPPYVRQESIPLARKTDYSSIYSLDKRSDLYAYFLARSLKLLSKGGIASVIASDKWLETNYGVKLQEKLRNHLISVYGQRHRSFGADINTAIVVYGKEARTSPVAFTYLETYGGGEVRRNTAVQRDSLKTGKWFYLRAPGVFLERILPKLTHKLQDFADVKFGIKTGANDFFYMEDISHLYEADRLGNPKEFEEWGVKARTGGELEKLGLVYVENEGGHRFVINKKDVKPIIKSPRQLGKYSITESVTLCLYTSSPGPYTKKYIDWGEKQTIEVRGGRETRKGYHRLETTKNRNPWYRIADLTPTHIILPKSLMDRLFVPFSQDPVLCDCQFYTLDAGEYHKAWLYLNSILLLITAELYARRLGGGAYEIMVDDYKEMAIPDLNKLDINYDPKMLWGREVLRYYEEVEQADKKALDIAVLKGMGFSDAETLLQALYRSYVELVEDRLTKAGSSLIERLEQKNIPQEEEIVEDIE